MAASGTLSLINRGLRFLSDGLLPWLVATVPRNDV